MSVDIQNYPHMIHSSVEEDMDIAENRKLQEPMDFNFSDVSLSKKEPKRILHFSDGVLEEYSTDDEEEDNDAADKAALVDPKALPWMPYIWYLTYWLGNKTLSICDYLGENLAHFFGITTPKYQYEIEEYQRILQEEEEQRRREEQERASGWISGGVLSTTASTEQLTNIEVEPSPLNITLKKVSSTGGQDESDSGSSVQWQRF